jgi:hypothetical protein
MENKDFTWVDEFLAKLENTKNGILEVDIGGTKIAAVISDDLKDFFKENRTLLVSLGKDLFKSFLMYIYEKKEEEAFMVLLQKMSVEQMIASLKGDVESLKKYNDDMDLFVKKLKKFATSVLLPLTAKVLLAALLA